MYMYICFGLPQVASWAAGRAHVPEASSSRLFAAPDRRMRLYNESAALRPA